MSAVPLLLKINSLEPASVVATALTPVRTSGAAADWMARSCLGAAAPAGGDHRTGDRLVADQLDRSGLAQQARGQIDRGRALRRQIQRLGAGRGERSLQAQHLHLHAGPARVRIGHHQRPGPLPLRHAGDHHRRGGRRRGQLPVGADGLQIVVPGPLGHGRDPSLAGLDRQAEGVLGLDQAVQRDRTRGARLDHQAGAAGDHHPPQLSVEAQVDLGLGVVGVGQDQLGPIGVAGGQAAEPVR